MSLVRAADRYCGISGDCVFHRRIVNVSLLIDQRIQILYLRAYVYELVITAVFLFLTNHNDSPTDSLARVPILSIFKLLMIFALCPSKSPISLQIQRLLLERGPEDGDAVIRMCCGHCVHLLGTGWRSGIEE